MRNKSLALIIGLAMVCIAQAQVPGKKPIRVVDTLSLTEQANRNPVLLRTELDSMIKAWVDANPQQPVQQPVSEQKNELSTLMLAGLAAVLVLVGVLALGIYRHQRLVNKTIAGLGKGQADTSKVGTLEMPAKIIKGKGSAQSLEKKISEMDAELRKLSKENEGLNGVIREYNGIQHEFDSLKHGLSKAYKVKFYPGYDKSRDEASVLQGVLDTEAAVATYAYEKFLKPILAITDANKNNPAKLSPENVSKLLDLLLSLSLLYIEYLYLRVSDLSIGGKMVERIKNFSNGNGLDPLLMKKLDTEFGSRALVMKLALDQAKLSVQSYPVFDETNLNPQ